ncbi:FUSC family protein [Nakamurella endophytica]|uniref:Integral membrane bound transporter domain-containing protein n=1 Tax=Nakamurella endophytica TaxID=1748367 RepID=A0A917SV00_9ACTN|nr:FUSC family protein [Nakamurella endophytica]GGL99972.1 hypothetical protein GCM10011594_20000 [Nakamurella endophytica]
MADGALRRWFGRHDPTWYATHRAVRAGIVVTAAFALAELTANDGLTTFASLGASALLLFVDFPGDNLTRAAGYLGLTVVGVVFVALGTLASANPVTAVAGMALVGGAVVFAGAMSAAIAAAGRAALLTFVLPVTLTGTAADIGPRVLGWLLAVALAVPAALFLWPPRNHDRLREDTAAALADLADLLGSSGPVPADRRDRSAATMNRLRATLRSTESRPVGLSTGSRLLLQSVEDVEWLRGSIAGAHRADGATGTTGATSAGGGDATTARRLGTDIARSTTALLRAAADVLDLQAADRAERRRRLDDALAAHAGLRDDIKAATTAVLAGPPGSGRAQLDIDRHWHTVAFAGYLVALTVAEVADADARPLWRRLLGRRPAPRPGLAAAGAWTAARQLAARHLDRESVTLRNALRSGLALALAVAVARVTGVEHAFWVVLGTLSVLRSAALNTGQTAVRALLGTVVGFAVGAGLIVLLGVHAPVLWALFPVAAMLAGFAPAAISFAAGQAAFTVLVLILFNIIVPTGWTVGVVRVEDVALGCAVGLVAGLVAWPRGAAGALRRTVARAYRDGAAELDAALAPLEPAGSPAAGSVPAGSVDARVQASLSRLDDAFRTYLAERGSKPVDLASLTAVVNGALRLHLVAVPIARLTGAETEPGDPVAAIRSGGAGPAVRSAVRLVATRGEVLARRYRRIADVVAGESDVAVRRWLGEVDGPGASEAAAAAAGGRPAPGDVRHVDALVLDGWSAHADGPLTAADAEALARTLWAALYLDDLEVLAGGLRGPLARVVRERGTVADPLQGRPSTAPAAAGTAPAGRT